MPGSSPGMTKEREEERSRHGLPQRGHLEVILVVADGFCDEARGDGRAVIVHDRHQPHGVDAVLVDDELAQLTVAVLF
ncbi:hypothetical protein, partial [Pseudomonas sp. EA_65y_Pfl1_P113]|uniref:hypothetical protein n=1 Tax=Pseudomonas sp. EA_65y_Pfl1_P113 TaxID=3088692 RepID=UPI0030DAA265